jgi:hypothetical protein
MLQLLDGLTTGSNPEDPNGPSQRHQRWSTCSFLSSLARLVQTAFDPTLETDLGLILLTLIESLVIPKPRRPSPSEIATFYHDFTLQLAPLPAEARNSVHQLVVDIVSALDDAYEGRPTQPTAGVTWSNVSEKHDSMDVDKGPKSVLIPSTPRIALATFTRGLVVCNSSTN